MSCVRVRALSCRGVALSSPSKTLPTRLPPTVRHFRSTAANRQTPLPGYIPYTQLDNIDVFSLYNPQKQPPPKPDTPTFYTGRTTFYETLYGLEEAYKAAASLLRQHRLVPFPEQAKKNLPPWRVAWKSANDMGGVLGMSVTAAHRRKLVAVLKDMHVLRRIALAGKAEDALALLESVLPSYEKPKSSAERHDMKDTRDEYGRSYALGKRKESAARVWMIPTLRKDDGNGVEDLPTTDILVNNLPLATYFMNTVDRTRAVRPLKVAGVFGQFNIFVLARGGGLSGQAGAIAHGIAKNLIMHRPDLEPILLKTKILLRDPRMVERKKTGQPKARKKYAWVRR